MTTQGKLLSRILGRRSNLEALRCLYFEKLELSGREIARRTGLSHPAIHKALGNLEAEGIVRRRIVAPAHQFQLNREHWVVLDVLPSVFEKENQWLDRLVRLLEKGLPESVVSIVLFGSAAKGKMDSKSDIDVLALVKGDKEKEAVLDFMSERSRDVYNAFQHPLAPVVLSAEEFLKQYRSGGEFAKEMSYSGRVIYGKLLTELLFEDDGKKNRP